jgi:hypothetical protein
VSGVTGSQPWIINSYAVLLLLCAQVFETRVNGAHVHPPSSLSRFVVRDTGNASPRLLRSTLNVVPVSTDMLNNSGMQFALSVQPLALPDPEDDPVAVREGTRQHAVNNPECLATVVCPCSVQQHLTDTYSCCTGKACNSSTLHATSSSTPHTPPCCLWWLTCVSASCLFLPPCAPPFDRLLTWVSWVLCAAGAARRT